MSDEVSRMEERIQKTVLNSTARCCSWLAFFLATAYMFYFFAVLPIQAFYLAAASAATSWVVLFAGYGLWKTETWWAREVEEEEEKEEEENSWKTA